MPIWKEAQVPSSIPFQQASGEGPRWSADALLESWGSEDRSRYPELGEVSEGMMEELKNFLVSGWLGRWDAVSLASMSQGLARLEQAGWDLERLSFEKGEADQVGLWVTW